MTSSVSAAAGTGSTAAGSASAAIGGGKMGKDEFIKLFVTQLQHQDPMNPMNADQLASQLAQFSSVEQLMNISGALEQQAAMNQQLIAAMSGANAVGILGKTVTALSDQVAVPASGDASVTVKVGGKGGTGVLHLYDERGNEVGSRELGEVKTGEQEIALGSAAEGLPAGVYRFQVEVTDAADQPVPVQGYVTGRADGTRHTADGPVVLVGGMEIPLVSVVEVTTN